MKNIATIGLVFALGTAYMIGSRLSESALTLIVGVIIGGLFSVVPSLIVVAILKPDKQEQQYPQTMFMMMPPYPTQYGMPMNPYQFQQYGYPVQRDYKIIGEK